MRIYFDLSVWTWPVILEYMGDSAPAPVLFDGNGWVKLKKGVIEWDTGRNGTAIYHYKQCDCDRLRSGGLFFADPVKQRKPWLNAKTR